VGQADLVPGEVSPNDIDIYIPNATNTHILANCRSGPWPREEANVFVAVTVLLVPKVSCL
jgi:hypothetical protein